MAGLIRPTCWECGTTVVHIIREAPLPGFVPQILPDKVPNIFHFIEVFKLFLVLCLFFFKSNRERASTHPNSNPNPNLRLGLRPERGLAVRFGKK